MDAEITKLLDKDDPEDAFHHALLQHGKRLIKMSKSARSKNYECWDKQEATFRGEIVPDNEDVRKAREGRPIKAILPTGYAQIMTFVSFHYLQFNQAETYFNLRPTGDEDYGMKKADSELTLQFQLRKNDWSNKQFQFLLDVGRFGEGVLECSWTKEAMQAWVNRTAAPTVVNGVPGPTPEPVGGWEEYIKYEGNLIRNVSPYRFFPDTRHPLVDFQKGEFCAIEEEFSMNQLYDLEARGEVAGVRHIQPIITDKSVMGATSLSEVMMGLRGPLSQNDGRLIDQFSADNGSSIALITKMQIWIVPSKFKLKNFVPGDKVVGQSPVKNADGEYVLGLEDHRVLYHLWFANNNRVIRLEQAKWWHNEFGFVVSQFTPDMHQETSFSLSELIEPLQTHQSWYMNSHIKSVDRVIQNRAILNPMMIDMKSYDGEGDIFIRKGVSVDPSKAVGQFRVQDVTGNHMNDAAILGDIIEQVTGVNKMMQGQSSTGRRSSFQDRTVAGGAASRMKMHGGMIWESGPGRLGRLMLSNARQSLSFEAFVRVVGKPSQATMEAYQQQVQQQQMQIAQLMQQQMPVDPMLMQMPKDPMAELQERYDAFIGTPEETICGDDYMFYDNTMPQDRGMAAQAIQELLMLVLQNPAASVQFDLSAKAMLEEILRLRDAGNVSRFSLKKRIAAGMDTPPMPPPQEQPAPQGPAGPQLTDAQDRSTTTTTHAPVIHIHNPKPESKAKAK